MSDQLDEVTAAQAREWLFGGDGDPEVVDGDCEMCSLTRAAYDLLLTSWHAVYCRDCIRDMDQEVEHGDRADSPDTLWPSVGHAVATLYPAAVVIAPRRLGT